MKTQKLFIHAGQSIFVWIITNVIAMFLYAIAPFFKIELDPYVCTRCSDIMFGYIIVIGLLFSFPVIFFLVPNLYVLSSLETKKKKILYAGISILVLSAVVILFFLNTLGTDGHDLSTVIIFLLPYVFGAEIGFFLIARNIIHEQNDSGSSQTAE
jgi:hypothetical protein